MQTSIFSQNQREILALGSLKCLPKPSDGKPLSESYIAIASTILSLEYMQASFHLLCALICPS